MKINWSLVFSTDKEYQAHIVEKFLQENDIQSVIINKKDSSYLLGKVELYVDRDRVMEVTKLINDHIHFE